MKQNLTLYWLKWYTRTSNGHLREYTRSVANSTEGRLQAAQMQKRANICDLWLMSCSGNIIVGSRFITDGERTNK